MTEQFSIEIAVRDYECDMQGIVNNSVYQNYLEHARHCFLKTKNIDFAAYAREGINLVVVRAELDYKASLTSGDTCRIEVFLERESKLRFAFKQKIVRVADEKLVMSAKVIGAAINERGRPVMPEALDALL